MKSVNKNILRRCLLKFFVHLFYLCRKGLQIIDFLGMKRFVLLVVCFIMIITLAENRSSEAVNSFVTNRKNIKQVKLGEMLMKSRMLIDSVPLSVFTGRYVDETDSLAQALHNDSARILVQNYRGVICYDEGNYGEATKHFLEGLRLVRFDSLENLKSKFFNNLGNIYFALNNYDKSLSYYRKSGKLDSLNCDTAGIIRNLVNVANIRSSRNRGKEALVLYKKAYRLAVSTGNLKLQLKLLNNIGINLLQMNDYASSFAYFNRALKIYTERKDTFGIAMILDNMGLAHFRNGTKQQAIIYYEKARKLAEEKKLMAIEASVYDNLKEYYANRGNYKLAYRYQNKSGTLSDSLIGEKKNQMIQKLEAQYNLERNRHEIIQLKQQNKFQLEELKNQQQRQKFLFIFSLLVIVCFLAVFLSFRKERIIRRQLYEKTRELETLNLSKDKFFSIIAHDLKNPFNALVSYTSLLREDFDRFSKKELKVIVEDLSMATDQGFKLLENLLYWTRSQTNQIKVFKTWFSMAEIVGEVENLAASNLQEKNQQLVTEIPSDLMVFADKDMVSTVLRNLIFNAIKFSFSRSQISLEVTEQNSWIIVTVKDEGIGIPTDKIKYLFRTDQNNSTVGTNGEPGSGLGLVICREFIEKNGGEIWVNSENGKGSEFSFSLPLREWTENSREPTNV